MREDVAGEFLFDRNVVQLNHASYGFPTRRAWERVAVIRRDLESDPQGALGTHLVEPFEYLAERVRSFLGLPQGRFGFTLNATEANETLRRSLHSAFGPPRATLPSDAYDSVRRAWSRGADALSETFRDKPYEVSVPSLVASSTARLIGEDEIAQMNGTFVAIDAAHGPGHVSFRHIAPSAHAIFGTLHKWLPSARPIGFLWLSECASFPLVPAIASLRRADEGMTALLSWRGTWDPAPVLGLATALDDWSAWHAAGYVGEAEGLADLLSDQMASLDIAEMNPASRRAPRLRSFVLPDVDVERARTHFYDARISLWLGTLPHGTIVRVAMNVYNDSTDVERLATVVQALVSERR